MNRNSYLLLVITAMLVASCKSEPAFEVKGTVAGADGKTIYLEQESLGGVLRVDSVRLNDTGRFTFKEPMPEYPEYYRLKLGKQQIPFAVDSLNNNITITADAESFATSYSVAGSLESARIKEIWLAKLDANLQISRLEEAMNGGHISNAVFLQHRDSVLNAYKKVATKYIFEAPGSAVAYYALFQQVNGQLIFNLYDPQDSKAFTAVANVMSTFFPENPRTKHLYNLALRSIAVIRKARQQQEQDTTVTETAIEAEKVNEIGYFDFTLPQHNGENVAFSTIAKGNPTLLCFSTMQATWAPQLNQILATLYEQYAPKGLKIVQVGLDSDNHIWLNTVSNLPWVNLQDKNGLYSELIGLYNIQVLPTIYLLSKEGEIVNRVVDLEQLPAQLEKLL